MYSTEENTQSTKLMCNPESIKFKTEKTKATAATAKTNYKRVTNTIHLFGKYVFSQFCHVYSRIRQCFLYTSLLFFIFVFFAPTIRILRCFVACCIRCCHWWNVFFFCRSLHCTLNCRRFYFIQNILEKMVESHFDCMQCFYSIVVAVVFLFLFLFSSGDVDSIRIDYFLHPTLYLCLICISCLFHIDWEIVFFFRFHLLFISFPSIYWIYVCVGIFYKLFAAQIIVIEKCHRMFHTHLFVRCSMFDF